MKFVCLFLFFFLYKTTTSKAIHPKVSFSSANEQLSEQINETNIGFDNIVKEDGEHHNYSPNIEESETQPIALRNPSEKVRSFLHEFNPVLVRDYGARTKFSKQNHERIFSPTIRPPILFRRKTSTPNSTTIKTTSTSTPTPTPTSTSTLTSTSTSTSTSTLTSTSPTVEKTTTNKINSGKQPSTLTSNHTLKKTSGLRNTSTPKTTTSTTTELLTKNSNFPTSTTTTKTTTPFTSLLNYTNDQNLKKKTIKNINKNGRRHRLKGKENYAHPTHCGFGDGENEERKTRRPRDVSNTEPKVIQKWNKSSITYSIKRYSLRYPKKLIDYLMEKAFEFWSEKSGAFFINQTGNRRADIEIRFIADDEHRNKFGQTCTFDGSLAHAFYPFYGGEIHINDAFHFSVIDHPSGLRGGYDLLQLFIHEIGHAIGLKHALEPESVMWPYGKALELPTMTSPIDSAEIRRRYSIPFDWHKFI